MPITDDDLKLIRFIQMYDDETVLDAVAAYRDADRAAEWWRLVVDLGNGKYAVTTFSDMVTKIKDGKKPFMESSLGSLVGSALVPIDVVVEQASIDRAAAAARADGTPSMMVAVVDQGELKGLIYVGTQRGGAGLFGSELVGLAGQYAELPTTGLISRRRQEALAAKKKKQEAK